MVKCPKCGAEIKYIPVTSAGYERSAVTVETETTEVIQDSGRVVRGYLRHRCPAKKKDEAPSTGGVQ